MRVAFHLEPYPGRTAETVRADLRYLIDRFGASDALLRGGAERGSGPVFFVYDSYLTAAAEWATLLGPRTDGSSGSSGSSVRGTALDGFFVGLWLTRSDAAQIERGGFDGAYTYRERRVERRVRSLAVAGDGRGGPVAAARVRAVRRPRVQRHEGPPLEREGDAGREGGRRYARRWRLALGRGARGGGRDELERVGGGDADRCRERRREAGGTPRTTSRRTRARTSRGGARRSGRRGRGARTWEGVFFERSGERPEPWARARIPALYLDVTRHFARRLASPGFDAGGAGEVPEDGAARGREEL